MPVSVLHGAFWSTFFLFPSQLLTFCAEVPWSQAWYPQLTENYADWQKWPNRVKKHGTCLDNVATGLWNKGAIMWLMISIFLPLSVVRVPSRPSEQSSNEVSITVRLHRFVFCPKSVITVQEHSKQAAVWLKITSYYESKKYVTVMWWGMHKGQGP